MELYDPTGQRLYLTDDECQAFAKAANAGARHQDILPCDVIPDH
jgi:hypothetical protein